MLIGIVGIYVSGYLLSVSRVESSSDSHPAPNGTRTLHVVSADLTGWKFRLFAPALMLDRKIIRPRYWSAYYVVISGSTTNLEYDSDRYRK